MKITLDATGRVSDKPQRFIRLSAPVDAEAAIYTWLKDAGFGVEYIDLSTVGKTHIDIKVLPSVEE